MLRTAPVDGRRRARRLTGLAQAAVLVVLPSGGQRGSRRNAQLALAQAALPRRPGALPLQRRVT
ncbi:MAG: hypothetical protein M3P46_02995 [Actinomycetota bacterium]|nr:hypothetical protein [Actinomycetota bacterium]